MTRQVEQKNISSPEQGSFGLNWRPVTGQEHFGAVEFVSLLYHMLPKYHGKAVTANLPNEKTGRKEIEQRSFYNLDELKKIVTEDRYEYISVNPFIGHGKRESDAAKYTNTIFIDVDAHQYESHADLRVCIHKTKIALEKAYADKTLPVPTMVTDTGRGLGIYYILDNSIALRKGSENQIRLYDQIYESLLTRYGQVLSEKEGLATVDWNVKDRARLCRLPGYRHDGAADNCYLAFVSRFVTVEELKAYKVSKEKPETGEKKPVKYHPVGRAGAPRVRSLRNLQLLRGDKCNDNCREVMLFIVYGAMIAHMNKETAIREIHAFNNNFTEPLPEKEVEHIIREYEAGQTNSESDPRYKPTNDWVRGALQITPEEEKITGFGKRMRDIINAEKNVQKELKKRTIAKLIYTTDKGYKDLAKEFGVSKRKVDMIAATYEVRRKRDSGKKHPEFEENAEAAVTEADTQPRTEEADTKEATAQPKAKNKKTSSKAKDEWVKEKTAKPKVKKENPAKKPKKETASKKGEDQSVSVPAKEYPNVTLMDRIVHPLNLKRAEKKVVSKKGSAGVDRMTVKKLPEYMEKHQDKMIDSLQNGTYQPKGLKRFEKEKEYAPGETRKIGIPTVIDRMIQQAVLQKLNPIFDPTFSSRSHGFRPGRSTTGALYQCQGIVESGYEYVIALDLSKYFDTIPQKKLMDIVGKTIQDEKVIDLLWKILEKGAENPEEDRDYRRGVPQGSPLSPLLGNIMLDQMDRYLEQHHIEFVRYADDCMMFFRSEEEARQTLETVAVYVEQVMDLKINRMKTVIGHISEVTYLGYGFRMNAGQCQFLISQKAVERIRGKIKNYLRWYKEQKSEFRRKTKQALRGWLWYYSHAETEQFDTVKEQLLAWIEREMQLHWPQPQAA